MSASTADSDGAYARCWLRLEMASGPADAPLTGGCGVDESTDHEQTIFDAARRIATPDDRRRYGREACGDDGRLRARVDALLRVYDLDSTFLPTPGAGSATDPDGPSWAVPGAVVGLYTLIRPIGQGGVGVVFLAEPAEPVRRPVALMLIRPGMGSGSMAARFDAERQTLALNDVKFTATVPIIGSIGPGHAARC